MLEICCIPWLTGCCCSNRNVCACGAAFDTDGSGTIDREEMGVMVSQLGLALSDDRIDQLMADADPDASGAIDGGAGAPAEAAAAPGGRLQRSLGA